MIQSMSMNLMCTVLPQNDNNFPKAFIKYFNSDKILKALVFLINVQH